MKFITLQAKQAPTEMESKGSSGDGLVYVLVLNYHKQRTVLIVLDR